MCLTRQQDATKNYDPRVPTTRVKQIRSLTVAVQGPYDFNFLASNFAPDGCGASAVPEPSALLLTLLGLMLLVGVREQQAITKHLAHPQGRG